MELKQVLKENCKFIDDGEDDCFLVHPYGHPCEMCGDAMMERLLALKKGIEKRLKEEGLDG